MNKKLEKALNELIVIVRRTSGDKKLQQEIMKIIKNRIPLGKVENLLQREIEIDLQYTDAELYWLLKAYYEKLSMDNLNPVKYFTELQVNEFENYLMKKPDISDVIVIENVKKTKTGIFHCYECSFEKIKQAQDDGVITYNFETQREAQVIENKGELITKATVVTKNVDNIMEEMKNNTFTPNTITWNILDDGTKENYEYDEKNETLTIYKSKGAKTNIIDGYHRTIAISKIVGQGYEIKNDYMFLTILNYNVEEAQRYIRQEQQGTKLSQSQRVIFKNDSYVSVAKAVNSTGTDANNSMKNQIMDLEKKVHKYNRGFVTLESFTDSIEYFYKNELEKPRDVKKVTKWIIDFFNEVVGECECFDNVAESKKTTALVHNNMICALVGLSEYIYSNDIEKSSNWEEKLSEMLNEVNFNIETNDFWSKKKMTAQRWDKATQKLVREVRDYLVKEYEKVGK